MKYRYPGSSGLLLSRITLGTMAFGAPDWGCNEKVSHPIEKNTLMREGVHQILPISMPEEYIEYFED
jgi:aryl-alcohol dehydrogenase-like predicted oxidoreductase